MKKIALIMVSMILGLTVLAGCDMLAPGGSTGGTEGSGEQTETKSPLETIKEKYAKLGDAATVTQDIGITQDGVVQYASQKTYTKKSGGYQMLGSEKRLNSLASGAAGPYTETPLEGTVKAAEFTVKLDLDELYFTKTTIENGTLEATVMDSSVETVFGVTGLTAPVHGLVLRIVTDEAHVTEMGISYASDGSDVSVTMKFSY